MARALNADAEITVRARYLAERDALSRAGATHIVFEEGEAGMAIARHVLERRGVSVDMIERLLAAMRRIWVMRG
jgi:hypothetical protein